MSIYVDTGIDYNKDNHCDIEGYFLNKDKMHKPICRHDNVKSVSLREKIAREFSLIYDDEHFDTPFFVAKEWERALYNYPLNDERKFDSSPLINHMLRNGSTITENITRIAVRNLDMATNAFTLRKDMYVFRGIGGSFFGPKYLLRLAQKNIGDVVVDQAFLSTSTSLFKACDFCDFDNENVDLAVIYKMKLKKGSKCAPIYVNNKQESEILLPRCKRFRITQKDCVYLEKKSKNLSLKTIVVFTMEEI